MQRHEPKVLMAKQLWVIPISMLGLTFIQWRKKREREEKWYKTCRRNLNSGFRREHDCKDLELGVRAMVECHACRCSSSFSFHSVFTLTGSMPGGDANHHNNMQQHSSLVYMHSSHRGCCLHCNGGTLVCVTVWKKSLIIDPPYAPQLNEEVWTEGPRLRRTLEKP